MQRLATCNACSSLKLARVGTKPGLWTLDSGLDRELDYGLDYGLNFGLDSVLVLPFKEDYEFWIAQCVGDWHNSRNGRFCSFQQDWLVGLSHHFVHTPSPPSWLARTHRRLVPNLCKLWWEFKRKSTEIQLSVEPVTL